jgi:GDPmannose 4,6-dehydratase
MSKRIALLTGVDGQDGSYLAELLLNKGYEVHGMIRKGVNPQPNIDGIRDKITLHYGDLANENHLSKIIHSVQADEIYNLGGQSDVMVSFEIPEYTGDVTGIGVTRMLEAIRCFSPNSRFYQASSSEMFGNRTAPPQNELSPFQARSPYAAAKIYAHNMTVCYREAYNMFACCGILLNHESERRGLNFVTRKISNAAAKIYWKKQRTLELGNLEAKRDWGYSPDYVDAMWLMLQQEKPDDYVIGTGEAHSVQEFVQAAFETVGLNWRTHVTLNQKFVRPAEVNYLRADASKAEKVLGWKPKTTFKELVKKMVEHDLEKEKPI